MAMLPRGLVAVVLVGLACGVVLTSPRHAQAQTDLDRLLTDVWKNQQELGRLIGEVTQLHGQGRNAEALPVAERAVAIAREYYGETRAEFASALSWLATIHLAQGRSDEAEQLFRRSLSIYEEAQGPEHFNVAATLNNLASVYRAQGRAGPDAESFLKRSVVISEKALGPDHPNLGTSLDNLGELYRIQGRFAEAEPLYKRALTIRENALGMTDPFVAISLNNLALLYRMQGRAADAEPFLKRSLAITEEMLGPEHPQVGVALNNLASFYEGEGRYTEAELSYKRTIAIWEKSLGPASVTVALGNLGLLYLMQSRYVDAELVLRRSLDIGERALGPEHPSVANLLNNLGALYRAQDRYSQAEAFYKRSLTIGEKAINDKVWSPDDPFVATALSNLAALALAQSDWTLAADYWRRSSGIFKRRAARGLVDGRGEGTGGDSQRRPWVFRGLIKASYRAEGGRPSGQLSAEMFETAQWAYGSEAAASLAQMAARSAMGSPELSELVRERQDLVGKWHVKDKLLIAAKSREPPQRNADAEKVLSDRLAAIDARLGEIDQRFKREFPDYATLASPAPVNVAEVQAQLRPDEALALFFDTPESKPLPEETFVWVVTKSEVVWVRSELGTAALARDVAALRCGLDVAAWTRGGAERCAEALGLASLAMPTPLPFDHARAHRLYLGLLGEVQQLLKGKHLLIVASGSLTQLPFQVLVTAPVSNAGPTSASGERERDVAWLARSHAVTVLPAVSSLKALRRVGRPSAASRPMAGFGNPLLDGDPYNADDADAARHARASQRCLDVAGQLVTGNARSPGGVPRVETRGGLADLAYLKRLPPLPETAKELCDVARDLGTDDRDIRLGAQATEREVKRLSATGELAKYRMLHFATHGALAGDLKGTSEPGLVLTPPETASEEDDGYLAASEIAGLKLDADWVILSACNTAAGAAVSAEALSGLARAFIYAQARALLVSHWEVASEATVKLVTTAVGEMAREPKVGRAEALRRAMLALIDKGGAEAHPAFWAPFVVVGEGSARP